MSAEKIERVLWQESGNQTDKMSFNTCVSLLLAAAVAFFFYKEASDGQKQLCTWGSEYNQKYWTSYWSSRSVAPTYEPYEPLAFYDTMCLRTCRGHL